MDYFKAFCARANHRLLHSPSTLSALVQDYCTTIGQYTPSPTDPPFYAIHHTILVKAISCKGQVGLYKIFVCIFGECALVNTTLGIQHLVYCNLPPLYVAINIAQCTVSPRPPCVAIHHTLLVMAILWKGQGAGGARIPDPDPHGVHEMWCRCHGGSSHGRKHTD